MLNNIIKLIYDFTNIYGKVNIMFNIIISAFIVISLFCIGIYFIFNKNKNKTNAKIINILHSKDKKHKFIDLVVEYKHNNNIYQSIITVPKLFNNFFNKHRNLIINYDEKNICNVNIAVDETNISIITFCIAVLLIIIAFFMYKIIFKSKFLSSIFGIFNLVNFV